MTGSVTFDVAIGGDGSTVTDDDNATTGLRDGGWRTRFVPCFTNQVSIANFVVTKANAANTSAVAAASSATSASGSATAAAASYDSFDDRYLGAKASDPTLDNDGNALLTGALYWNSTSSVMKVYSGSAWITAYLPSSSYLALSGGTMTGAITFVVDQTVANLAAGSAGTIPYQSASGSTAMLTAGEPGQVLTSAGAGAPIWSPSASLTGITNASNTALGVDALASVTTGVQNVANGYQALFFNTTGVQNTANGTYALFWNTTGYQNTANGYHALFSNTTGVQNTANGYQALFFNTTGVQNTANGYHALFSNTIGGNNVANGANALYSNTTGNYNVGIGYGCDASSATVSNEVNIYNGVVTARFQGGASAWSFISDVRDKTNIIDLKLGLNFVNKLQPRKFEWDLRHTGVDKGKAASGFIAQEVLNILEQEDALFTGIVDTNDSEKYMLAQTNLIPILVNAIKELSAELTALKLKVGN